MPVLSFDSLHKFLLLLFRLVLLHCFAIGSLGVSASTVDVPDLDPDAVVKQLEQLKGVERIPVLIDLGKFYNVRSDQQKGLPHLLEALELLENVEDTVAQCQVYYLLASAYLRLEDKFIALEYAEKARLLSSNLEDLVLRSECLRVRANVSLTLRQYQQALDYLNASLELARQAEQSQMEARVLNSIAICFWRMKDWDRSIRFLEEAIEQNIEDERFYYLYLNNLGVAYMEAGRYDEARANLDKTLEYQRSIESEYAITLTLSNLADLEQRMGNATLSLEYLDEVFDRANQNEYRYVLARSYRFKALSLVQLGQSDEAKYALMQSLENAQELNDPAELMDTYSALIDVCIQGDDYEAAFRFKTQKEEIEKALLTEELRSQSILFSIQYDNESQRREIALLNNQKELATLRAEQEALRALNSERDLLIAENETRMQQIQRNGLMAGLLVLFIVAGVFYMRYHEVRRFSKAVEAQKEEIHRSHESLQAANDRLLQLNKEKDSIVGVVAHDLKSPLMGQLGMAELIHESSDTLSKEEIREMSRTIISSAEQMNAIITNLLEISRIEEGVVAVHPVETDAASLMERIIGDFQFALREKSQHLSLDQGSAPANLVTDPMLLRQIVDNLISNAIKYSPIGSQVRVSLEATPNDRLRISVKDEGPGLSNEDRAKLFTKYARLSSRPTGGESSTGLGLSIVKRIAEMLEGEVGVETELGFGCCFWVELPLNAHRSESIDGPTPA